MENISVLREILDDGSRVLHEKKPHQGLPLVRIKQLDPAKLVGTREAGANLNTFIFIIFLGRCLAQHEATLSYHEYITSLLPYQRHVIEGYC